MSTEDVAIARLGFGLAQPSEGEAEDAARVQRGIDATMRAVITDRYDPTRCEPMPRVTVAGAVPVKDGNELSMLPRGSGWVEPRPLAPPPGQDIIERLADAALPHGPQNANAGGVPKQDGKREGGDVAN